jgi:uncharacterized protein (TIGR04255 family)
LFQSNPLAEVICQLQFPTVLRIAADVPSEFQERIRQSYPEFRQDAGASGLPPDISQVIANLPINVQQGPIYSFENEGATRTITLTRDAVSITERQYTRWEDLRAEIELVRSALEEIYQPSFYSRIGLRYQDVLDPSALGLAGVPWSDLLHPAVAGLLGAEDEIRSSVRNLGGAAEIEISEIADAAVRLQYGLVQGSEGGSTRPFALDADFFTTQRSAFEHVPTILDTFNNLAGNLFRWAITERLRDALRPTPLEG